MAQQNLRVVLGELEAASLQLQLCDPHCHICHQPTARAYGMPNPVSFYDLIYAALYLVSIEIHLYDLHCAAVHLT